MKRRVSGTILGVALGRTRLRVAEVTCTSSKTPGKATHHSVDRAAEFIYPEGLSPAKPEELGKALKAFLREKKISTRQAVFGLSAEWLVTRTKSVPPAAPVVAAGALRMEAEGEFSAEPDDLLVDYAGTTSATAATTVLLVATGRQHVEQAQTLARAAGLQISSLGATALALAALTREISEKGELIVSLTEDGAELIVQHGAGAGSAQLRHYALGGSGAGTHGTDSSNKTESGSGGGLGELAGEVRRTVAMMPRNGSPVAVALWLETSEMRASEDAFAKRLALPVRTLDVRKAVNGNPTDAQRCADAVALAVAAFEPDGPAVDFLHSRLAVPKARRSPRKIVWAIAIAATLVIAAVVMAESLIQQQHAVESLYQNYDALKGDSKTPGALQKAEVTIKRLDTAHAWTSTTPYALACLRDMTALFPDDGVIWATNFTLQSDGHGQVAGKATSYDQVEALLARITKDNKKFGEPKLMDNHDASRNGREIVFAISFMYRGQE